MDINNNNNVSNKSGSSNSGSSSGSSSSGSSSSGSSSSGSSSSSSSSDSEEEEEEERRDPFNDLLREHGTNIDLEGKNKKDDGGKLVPVLNPALSLETRINWNPDFSLPDPSDSSRSNNRRSSRLRIAKDKNKNDNNNGKNNNPYSVRKIIHLIPQIYRSRDQIEKLDLILRFLHMKEQPCGLTQIHRSLGVSLIMCRKYLNVLLKNKKILRKKDRQCGLVYYINKANFGGGRR